MVQNSEIVIQKYEVWWVMVTERFSKQWLPQFPQRLVQVGRAVREDVTWPSLK